MEELKYWIWLSRIEGLNPKLLWDLIEKYKNPKEIWNKTKEELISDGIKEIYADRIINNEFRTNLDKYLKRLEKFPIFFFLKLNVYRFLFIFNV